MAYSINRRLSDLIRSDGTIDTSKILDATIATADIANDAITADKIVDNIALAGNITTTGTLAPVGVLTANAGVVVDNITIDGTQIDLSSGDLTIDVANDIILDADGGDIWFNDGGTNIAVFKNSSSHFFIESSVQDKDILIRGNDGGSTITALEFDMSDAGTATFNHDVNVGGDLTVTGNFQVDGTTTTLNTATLNVEDKNIILNYGSGDTSSTANGSGITIQDAVSSSTDASILWDTTADRFNFSDDIGWVSSNNVIKADLSSGGTTRTAEILFYNGSNGALELKTHNASSGGINFYTQGAERMRVARDGKIGIGTTSPTSPFEIVGAGGYNLHFSRGNSTPGGTDPWLGLFNNTNIANATYGWGWYDSGTDGSLQLWNKNNSTTGYEVITFKRGGKIGIGTTSPNLKLHVEESAADAWIADFKHTHADAYGLRIDLSGTTSSVRYALGVYTGGGTGMFVRNNGMVGIGTNAPIAPLHVSGNAVIETGSPDLYLATTSASHTNWRIAAQEAVNQGFEIASGTTSASSNAVADTYTTRLTIKSDGKVGIGTTSPAEILHTSTASNNVGRFTSTDQIAYIQIDDTDDSLYITSAGQKGSFGGNASVHANNLNIDLTNGKVGIGTTSPSHTLDVTGTIRSYSSGSGNAWLYTQNDNKVYLTGVRGSSSNAYSIYDLTEDHSRFRVNSDGGVCIGEDNVGYAGQILSIKSGTGNNVLYGESSDANCIVSLRDSGSSVNVGYGAISNAHVFFQDGTEIARLSTGSGDKYSYSSAGIGGSGTNLHLHSDDSEIRMANNIIHSDNSGFTKFTIRTGYGVTSDSAELSLDAGYISFNTGSSFTERMRVTGGGYVGVGVSPTRLLHVQGSTAGLPIAHFKNTNNDCVGIRAEVDSNAGNNFIMEAMNSDGQQWKIRNDGRHYGTYQSIQSISDERLKKDVSSLTYDINKFKTFNPVNYKWINPELHGNRTEAQIGFLAQEVKTVDERFWNSDTAEGDDIPLVDSGIAQSVELSPKDAMYISVIKQLITRLEAAEAKITALEG